MITVVVLTTGGYCYACPPSGGGGPPITEQLYLVPGDLYAQAGAKFQIRARMITDAGNTLPTDAVASVNWEVGALTLLSSSSTGPTIEVQVPSINPAPTYTIKAKLPPYQPATLEVRIVDGTAAAFDWITSNPTSPQEPMLALYDGFRDSDWLEDQMVSFVGRGVIDYLSCPTSDRSCGEVTLFGPTIGVTRVSGIKWTASCNAYDFPNPNATPTSGCSLTAPASGPAAAQQNVSPAIWILTKGGVSATPMDSWATGTSIGPPATYAGVDETARADIEYAIKVYRDGYAGLNINPTYNSLVGPDDLILYLPDDMSCDGGARGSVREQLEAHGVGFPGGKTIVVAYVKHVYYETTNEPLNGYSGFTCPWDPGDGSIIVISWDQWTPTTLAHEFGHALGPWQTYPYGHADDMPPYTFTRQNIMWPGESSSNPWPRSIITLGQSFRLSLDANALVNRGVGGLDNCSAAANKCPKLDRDVSRP